jgi:hypothetical protein
MFKNSFTVYRPTNFFAVVIIIKFLELFRYSGEKVAQMGYKKGEMPVNLT